MARAAAHPLAVLLLLALGDRHKALLHVRQLARQRGRVAGRRRLVRVAAPRRAAKVGGRVGGRRRASGLQRLAVRGPRLQARGAARQRTRPSPPCQGAGPMIFAARNAPTRQGTRRAHEPRARRTACLSGPLPCTARRRARLPACAGAASAAGGRSRSASRAAQCVVAADWRNWLLTDCPDAAAGGRGGAGARSQARTASSCASAAAAGGGVAGAERPPSERAGDASAARAAGRACSSATRASSAAWLASSSATRAAAAAAALRAPAASAADGSRGSPGAYGRTGPGESRTHGSVGSGYQSIAAAGSPSRARVAAPQ